MPIDSPLARMIRNWKDSLQIKVKDKKKIIKYYVVIWTKEPIKRAAVFWPKYWSDKDWVCWMLNLSANNKTPFSDEEMAYATC